MGTVVNHPKWYVSLDRLGKAGACPYWKNKWRREYGDASVVLTCEVIERLLNLNFPMFWIANLLREKGRISLDQFDEFEGILFSMNKSDKQKANRLYNFIQRL